MEMKRREVETNGNEKERVERMGMKRREVETNGN